MNEELYWSKVQKTDTCWFWIGAKTDGYGQLCHKKVNYKAHRVAWELANGAIPEGMQIDHMCGIRACVNPKHLRLVSLEENLSSRNTTYKIKPRPGTRNAARKKTFLLYIHNPRFGEEEKKSELVNSLLDEYYSMEQEVRYVKGNWGA